MNKEQEKEFLLDAERMAAENVDYCAFQNYFFSQGSGLLKDMSRDDRFRLIKSPFYRKLRQYGTQLGLSQGYLSNDKTTGKPVAREFSGEFRLRVAKSLHQELVIEARREKVSLNQLCLIKLARPLQPTQPVV